MLIAGIISSPKLAILPWPDYLLTSRRLCEVGSILTPEESDEGNMVASGFAPGRVDHASARRRSKRRRFRRLKRRQDSLCDDGQGPAPGDDPRIPRFLVHV